MSKIALIIGNSKYIEEKDNLKNPINDAQAMHEILEYKGFNTTIKLNLNSNEMKEIFDNFLSQINEEDTIIFYYAGHGVEDRDTNYLLPIDYSHPIDETCLSIDEIQNKLNKKNYSGIKIIIADACRNTPTGFETNGFSKTKSIHNTLIAFSTSPNNTAKDGKDNLSYYTKNLIINIRKYNLSINEVFQQTREAVLKETNFEQIPWEHSSLISDFTFDNIKVPNKLYNMISLNKDFVYSIKNIKDLYFIGGASPYINFVANSFSKIGLIKTRKNIKNINYHINEIDINNNCLVAVNDNCDLFYLLPVKENGIKIKKIKFSLFTVSIKGTSKNYP